MKKLSVRLKEIKDVYDFVAAVTAFPGEVDIVSGRYRVNAKSIMGIFALDLTQSLDLEIFDDDCEELIAALQPYIG
ncbi:MAG: HPr family phosphocarrier protein [Clostridia bacterium]|jgi:phosphotransferase system HPr-like phosphotransfer protein|nr:HPr family phosphocarrier protein [Clostridia bacterium]MBQ3870308.1 HPr family phosphocarrier protein [Clostridia bacterium]